MPEVSHLFSGGLQYGAFAFAAFALCIIAWMVKRFLRAFGEHGAINQRLADTVEMLNSTLLNSQSEVRRLTDQLLSRPCLLDQEIVDKVRRGIQEKREETEGRVRT